MRLKIARKDAFIMPNDPLETYLDHVNRDLQKISSAAGKQRLESLKLQGKFLSQLALRHRHWSKHTDIAEAASLHMQVADMIQQIFDKYDNLLQSYERDPAK